MIDPHNICKLIDDISLEKDGEKVASKMRLADDMIGELKDADDRQGMAIVSNRMLDHIASVATETELKDIAAIRLFITEHAAGRRITRQQSEEAVEALARFMMKYRITPEDIGL